MSLLLFHQPTECILRDQVSTERIIPGSGVGSGGWGEGLRRLRVDKILRSQVQSLDETTFIIFCLFYFKI